MANHRDLVRSLLMHCPSLMIISFSFSSLIETNSNTPMFLRNSEEVEEIAECHLHKDDDEHHSEI